MAVDVVGVPVDPGLPDVMQTVGSTISGDCQLTGVAHGALGDLRRVPLQPGGIHIVVRLQRGKFRVR